MCCLDADDMISPEYFLRAMELVRARVVGVARARTRTPSPKPLTPTPTPNPRNPNQVAKSSGVNLVYANQQFFYESKWQWNVPELRVKPCPYSYPYPPPYPYPYPYPYP